MKLLENFWNVLRAKLGWNSLMGTVSIPLETGYTNDGPKIKMMPDDTMILVRKEFTDISTIGELYLDGDLFCYMIELSCRKANPLGKLAIPAGKYEITMTDSPESPLELKFGFSLPLINGVPGREGIRQHPANFASQLEGCQAPGYRFDTDVIFDSRNAFFKLKPEIAKRLNLGKFYINVVGGR